MLLIDVALFSSTVAIVSYEIVRAKDKLIEILRKDPVISEYDLVLGYKESFLKRVPITLDLKIFPSLSISGISNSGKSKLTEYILKHTNLEKVLVNSYKEDYKGIKCKKVTLENTEKFLDLLLEGKLRNKLIVFDECLTILSSKNCAKKLHTLLTKNRHLNLYIICIFQELNKSIVPFKSLFTSRLTMRMIQKSDVESSLGISLEEYKVLQNREFILLSDDIYFGKTYDI